MTPELMNKIIKAVQHAKEKHPDFCVNGYHAISLATEELGELAKAINDGNWEQAELEALDTIAVLVRTLEMPEFYLESLPGDTVKVDKVFWNPFKGWPFDTLYEVVGRGLKHGKNNKSKRNIRVRGCTKRKILPGRVLQSKKNPKR